jgi:cyclopropane fatty-acyl-phospholipid synthase-like methyltransferase
MNLMIEVGKLLGVIPAPLVDCGASFWRARAILEANRMGVFQALEGGPRTAAEVAERTRTSAAGMEVLLTALVACGYLTRHGEGYANAAVVRKWILDSGRGLTHGLLLALHLWDRATELGECVRLGRPLHDPHAQDMRQPGSPWADLYVRAMRAAARLTAPHIVPRIRVPAGARRLVDLGGSHGATARAVVARHPGLEATVFDLPGPVEAARRLAQADGDRPGVRFEVKDLLEDDLGTGWDVALMAHVVHLFVPEQVRRIFQKAAAGLRPGGTLAVVDMLRGISRGRDTMAAMMGLTWLTVGGRSYTAAEVVALMEAAGLRQVAVTKLPPHAGATLVQGTR